MAPIVALGALAVAAGIAHSNALAFSFGVLLIAGPIALYAVLWKSLRGLKVDRFTLAAVFEGESVTVTLRLRNRSRFPVFYPIVADVFSPGYDSHPVESVFPYRILAGETVEQSYIGRCDQRRGIFKLGPLTVAVSDPFGWIQIRKRVSSRPTMKVYPRIQPFGMPRRSGRAVAERRMERHARRRGESLEFFSVREYRVGDPPRRIHWPLTAHLGTLVVREYTEHATGDVTIFLDLCRRALVGVGRGSSLEHAIKIAVAVANRALRSGHGVEVVAHGQRAFRVPTARGLDQLGRVLDLTVELRPDGIVPLDELIAAQRPRLKRGDTVLYPVSPYLHTRDAFYGEIGALARLGLRQVAVILDERTFRALSYEESSRQGQAAEIAARLRKYGVETHSLICGADLTRLFRAPAVETAERSR